MTISITALQLINFDPTISNAGVIFGINGQYLIRSEIWKELDMFIALTSYLTSIKESELEVGPPWRLDSINDGMNSSRAFAQHLRKLFNFDAHKAVSTCLYTVSTTHCHTRIAFRFLNVAKLKNEYISRRS